MDFTLRCNSLKCRAALTDRALVTTCSHIFCLDCAQSLGLAANGIKICPACETELPNQDDAAVTCLNPTEDYKTSVLSGMSPSIVMECAGRALAFYSYQTTQEIIYQEYMAKSLTEKYGALSSQLDKIIHDANTEILGLRERVEAMHSEQKDLQQRNHELVDAFKEKSRNQQQLQKLYQSLKAQVMASAVQTAASDDAEHTLQMVTGNHTADRLGTRGFDSQIPSFSVQTPAPRLNPHRRRNSGIRMSERSIGGSNAFNMAPRSFSSHSTSAGATSGIHRTRLPISTSSRNHGHNSANPIQTPRQPLGAMDPNSVLRDNTGSFGLSAGMRVGKQGDPQFSRIGAAASHNSQMAPPEFIRR